MDVDEFLLIFSLPVIAIVVIMAGWLLVKITDHLMDDEDPIGLMKQCAEDLDALRVRVDAIAGPLDAPQSLRPDGRAGCDHLGPE